MLLGVPKINKDPLLLVRPYSDQDHMYSPPIVGADSRSLLIGTIDDSNQRAARKRRKRSYPNPSGVHLTFVSDTGVAVQSQPVTSSFHVQMSSPSWVRAKALGLKFGFKATRHGKRYNLNLSYGDRPPLAVRWSRFVDEFELERSMPFDQYNRVSAEVRFIDFLERLDGHFLEWERT